MREFPGLNPHDWKTIQPYYDELQARPLTRENVSGWLQDWSDLDVILGDAAFAANRAVTENTADERAEQVFLNLVATIMPEVEVAEQKLREKLLDLKDYEPSPDNTETLHRLRDRAGLFNEANVPIMADLARLENDYNKIVGNMSVTIDGRDMTMQQANELQFNTDRGLRERGWRTVQERWLEDRNPLDDLYLKMLAMRRQVARNAGMADFRAYTWHHLYRFSYTPEDCLGLHEAIAAEAIPLLEKHMARRKAGMGVNSVRPWDLDVDPAGRPGLKPFERSSELEEGVQRIFNNIDPALGGYFACMRGGFLDLESRPNKAPGAYCGGYNSLGKPYIFANAVGIHDDVDTLLHESGHAFHFMECASQPLIWNKFGLEAVNYEFGEVASMSMELLGSPYLERENGGFYSKTDANRARAEHLLSIIRFLPYMSVVDSFQHWVYAEAPENVTAADLDRKWGQLWDRFMSWQDWSGLENEKVTGWHRKGHIFGAPFYYIEYGLAQLGAIQVWRNAMRNRAKAVADYRHALSLGNTRSLPQLFEAAGARLVFDRPAVHELMQLVDSELEKLGD